MFIETLNKVPNGVVLLDPGSKEITFQNKGMTRILDSDPSKSVKRLSEYTLKKKCCDNDLLGVSKDFT